MRRIVLPALLLLSSGSIALACTNDFLFLDEDHHHHHHDAMRNLGGQVVAQDGNKPTPPGARQSHAKIGWSYKPNYGYDCRTVGCCGLQEEAAPQRQLCGPEFWRFLDDASSVRCVSDGVTNQQSPINFMTTGSKALKFKDMAKLVSNVSDATPVLTEEQCEGEVEFLDSTWEVAFHKSCKLSVKLLGKTWKLLQFHFHNAEHTVNSMYMPLEVHLVHRNDDGDLLVLGVFLSPGKENEFFSTLEATSGNDTKGTRQVNPYDVLPDDLKYWHYKGSLTTPPCQRADGAHVEWFVFQEPVQVSMGQLAFFGSYFTALSHVAYNGMVNRPVQPLANSTVVYEFSGVAATTAPSNRRLRHLA